MQLIEPSDSSRPARPALSAFLATLTSPRMLLIVACFMAIPTAGVIARYLARLDGVVKADGEVATGDFLVFYMGGRMVLEGGGADLYDQSAQRRTQDEITGPGYRYHHWFVNPPLLAVALAPLAALPFVTAFYVYDALMLAAMIAALALLRPHLPGLSSDRTRWWATVLLVLTFHPIARTVFGGQNTPLTFLLLAAIYACLCSGRPVWAGLLLGALSYKPQYLMVIIPVLLLRRSWPVLAGAGAGFLGHYALGALACGADWPLRMAAFLSDYRISEAQTNFHLHIALLPVLRHALASPWDGIMAGAAIAAVLGVALWSTWRCPVKHAASAGAWSVLICASLLVSPHTQYYDAGLVALAAVLALECMTSRGLTASPGLRLMLICGYLAYPAYRWVEVLGFQPLVLWPALTFAWAVSVARLERDALMAQDPREVRGILAETGVAECEPDRAGSRSALPRRA